MTNVPQSKLLELTRQIVEGCSRGEFVEGMENFYADDVYHLEIGDGSRKDGKANIIAGQKEFLQTQVEAFHGVDIGHIGVATDDGNGNGVTFAEYTIKVDLKDGSKFWPVQVHVFEWKDEKIVACKYYYNPDFNASSSKTCSLNESV